VVGYRTDTLPGFFTVDTGLPVPHRADSPGELAELWRHHRALGRREGVLVVQPPPSEAALPGDVVDRAVDRAMQEAADAGIAGPRVTPFLLAAVERATGGRSLPANLALLEANARLAAEIAVALTG
jgi:pseudouridine-5'-phosphate glycosidase